MKTIFTFIFVLLLGCCGQTVHSQSINAIDSCSTLISQLIKKSIHTSIGDSLILNEFEKEWEVTGYYPDKEIDGRSESEKWLTDLYIHLYEKYDLNKNNAAMIDKKYFHELFNITPVITEIFEKNILDNQFDAIIINVATHQNYELYSILTENINLECNHCEYGQSVRIQSLVAVSNHKIVDILIAAYIFDSGLGIDCQFFFYDDELIHTKRFGSDEARGGYGYYQKYQITPQGRFIRYYDQDGIIKNDYEQGFVKNHTREKKWVEINNGYYIEAEYKDGISVGEWNFYRLEQEYDENGHPILSSRKKGKLLYTETYEHGTLVKREFVK